MELFSIRIQRTFQLVSTVHGEVFEISAGEFKESGTSISTMAVVIKK